MKKKKIQLIILLGVLLLTVGFYFCLKTWNESQSEAEITVEEVAVMEVNIEEVTGFSYDYEGTTYSFLKTGENWICENDTTLDLDESQVQSLIGNITKLTSEYAIADAEDLEQYGLEIPARTVVLETANQEYKIMFGDYNSIISKYYILVNEDTTVYTTSGYRYTSFDIAPEELVAVEESAETETVTEDAVEESALEETIED